MSASLSALADWCRMMRHQLAAGVSVTKMLERATTSGPAEIRELSTRLLAAAKSGQPLAPALDAARLPPTFVPLFRVGEEMGRLPDMLAALEDDLRQEEKRRRQFQSQTLYPRLQFFAAILIITTLIWILGAIAGNNRPTITVFGLAGTKGALIFLACTLGPVLLGWLAFKRLFADPVRRGRLLESLRSLPFVGSCLEALAIHRFARALGCTLDSGLPIAEAVTLAFDASPYLRLHSEKVVRALKEGRSLGDALAECPLLPADFVAIVDSAEHAGSVPEAMRHEAVRFGELASDRLTMVTRIAAGAVWLAVTAFIVICILRLASIYLAALGA